MNIGFLIINYNMANLTILCVDQILLLKHSENAYIFVVDNSDTCSDEEKLKETYKDNAHVMIIKTIQNEGFSKGNNIGYSFIKSYDLQFLIVMNNDVFIYQHDFIQKIMDIYALNKFYICGPDIYIPKIDYHSNPMQYEILYGVSLEEEKRKNENVTIKDIIMFLGIESGIYRIYKKSLWKIKNRLLKNNKMMKTDTEQKNIVLQGACLIFSEKFIEKNEKLFYPETFMYYEENILALNCLKNNWLTLYTPDIKVIHWSEGSSKRALSFLNSKKIINKKKKLKRESLKVYEKMVVDYFEGRQYENKNII